MHHRPGPPGWDNFADLVRAGVNGVDAGLLMRRGIFSQDYNALPVITVFDKWIRR